MRIFNRSTIRKWQRDHANTAGALEEWFQVAKAAKWQSLADVRQVYNSADQVDCCLVFNIRGNQFRLIARVSYASKDRDGALWLKHFLPHADYDKDTWKKDCQE